MFLKDLESCELYIKDTYLHFEGNRHFLIKNKWVVERNKRHGVIHEEVFLNLLA
jgi:hypothetical protein